MVEGAAAVMIDAWSLGWPVPLQGELELAREVAMLARARVHLVELDVMWWQLLRHVPAALMAPGTTPGARRRHVVARHDGRRHRHRVAAAIEARGGGHGRGPVVIVAGTVGGSIPWLN